MTWQTIDSAPKDGTRILFGGCIHGPSIRVGSWGVGRYLSRTRGYEMEWVDGPTYGFHPTHWMPLPDAPA